jgi:hypothetical protein
MTLAALIRRGAKAGTGNVATATPATDATEWEKDSDSVARVATAAVANLPGAHYRWRVILADDTPLDVCCLPELTLTEMRELYRGATVQPVPGCALRSGTAQFFTEFQRS